MMAIDITPYSKPNIIFIGNKPKPNSCIFFLFKNSYNKSNEIKAAI